MSSGRNYSVFELRRIVIARQNNFEQLFHQRFRQQETRLFQRPSRTGVLIIEQQNLNKRVSDVHDASVLISEIIAATGMMFEGFLDLQPHFQQQLLDQISTSFSPMFDEIGVRISNLEFQVEQLESIILVYTDIEKLFML